MQAAGPCPFHPRAWGPARGRQRPCPDSRCVPSCVRAGSHARWRADVWSRCAARGCRKAAAERVFIYMQVQHVSILRDAAPFWLGNAASGAAVDALGVEMHEAADFVQRLRGTRRDRAVCIRADVQKEISALADAFDQLFDQHIRAFIIVVRGAVAPVPVHRCADLPVYGVSVGVEQSAWGNDLFRAYEIAVIRRRMPLGKRAEALTAAFEAVVQDDVRLKRAHHVHKLACTPALAAHVVIRKIEPHDVDFSVI